MATSTSISSNIEFPANEGEEKEFRDWFTQGKSLDVLVTGKSGAGKSTLLNSMLGQVVAKEGNTHDPETKEVTEYKTLRNGREITVWDSPGLQDGTNKEEEYLADMKAKCKDMHLLLYCISLKSERSDLDCDESAICKLTQAFGPEIWNNAVFVLTFANFLQKRLKIQCKHESEAQLEESFEARISQWKEKIQGALRKLKVADEVMNNINIEVAGHYRKPSLPGRPFWVTKLWLTCLLVMKDEAKSVMLALNSHRMKEEKDVKHEDFVSAASEADVPIVLDHSAIVGLSSGLMAGVGIGSVIGGVIGGVVIGAATLGIGFGIGVGVGAAAGAGIGLGIGAGAYPLAVSLWRRSKKKKTS